MVRQTASIVLLIPVALSLALFPGCGRSGSEAEVTNLVLIVVDTLRPDHLGCYGYPNIATPMIDNLARGGTLFEQAITPVPVTQPAFASLLTSTFPPTHGVRDNGLYTLSENMLSLAEVLQEEGFRTAAFLGSAVMDTSTGLGQGFDTYDDKFEGYYRPNRPEYLPLAEEIRRTRRRADTVTRNALRWIKGNKRSRFFVMVHYFDPHAYYDPPVPFDSLYAGNPYDGEIAYTDRSIGVLLNGIRSFKIPGRTLVVVAADHGEGLMEHGEAQHGLLIYDSTLRVPLIFNCPEVCPAGLRVPNQVSLVDVAPTVLTLLSVRCPGSFQGTNLSPVFKGGGMPELSPLYCETFRPRLSYGWSDLEGIRTEEWKYIRAPEPELYDLVHDAREGENLAGTGLAVEDDLARRLEGMTEAFPAGDSSRPIEIPRDDVTRERLQALGYLAGLGETLEASDEPLADPKYEMEAFNRRQLASYHTRIGSALIEGGQIADAVLALQKAAEIEPASPVRHSNLGAAYARQKDYGRALDSYREALRLNPDYLTAYLHLARIHEARGDTLAAVRSYRAALDRESADEAALVGLARLEVNRGRIEDAIGLLRGALGENLDNATLLGALAEAYRRAERYPEAARIFGRWAALQPLNSEPAFYLGHVYAHLGAPDEAVRWYERAIELDPEMSEAYYNIACIYSLQNRKDEAILWLQKALDHGFDDIPHMRKDPDLERLHGDPKFEAMLRPRA